MQERSLFSFIAPHMHQNSTRVNYEWEHGPNEVISLTTTEQASGQMPLQMVFKENAETVCPKGRAVSLEVVPNYHKALHSPLESRNNWETRSVRKHQFQKRLSDAMRRPDPGIPINKMVFSFLLFAQHGSIACPQATPELQKENKTNLLLSLAQHRMWPLAKSPFLCLHNTWHMATQDGKRMGTAD